MSSLREVLADYLRMRRALGYKLEAPGRRLHQFVSYLERTDARTVTIENAVAWATQPASADPSYWGARLSVVRQFARHLQTLDPACEVPPARLLPCRSRRAIPYPYTEQEIATLMAAAARLPSPMMAATYPTLLGLLAVSGLRLGEAVGLDREDVDARHGLVRVINSNFGKSREVPLHDSTMRALATYSRRRDQLCRSRPVRRSFSRAPGPGSFTPTSIGHSRGSSERSAWQRARPAADRGCTISRHRFAVNTLIDWYRHGVDVQARLPVLSTYIGHVEPRDTYWYLSAAPELLGLVVRRLERTIEQAVG